MTDVTSSARFPSSSPAHRPGHGPCDSRPGAALWPRVCCGGRAAQLLGSVTGVSVVARGGGTPAPGSGPMSASRDARPESRRPSAQLCNTPQRSSTAVRNDRNASSNSSSLFGDDGGATGEIGNGPVSVIAGEVTAVRRLRPTGDPSPVVGSHPGAAEKAPLFPTVTSEKSPELA